MAALRTATIAHSGLACDRPYLIHGAVAPSRALVTLGDTTQVEALTRPGELVGGDPLFDLASALLARHPEPFRQGLREGYTAIGPLDAAQEARLRRLGLLLLAADTLWRGDAQDITALPDRVAAELRALGEG